MKKLIPPFLFLICIALMVIMAKVAPDREIIPKPYNYIGIIPIILGLFMTIKVRKYFNRVDTEIHTFKRPRKIVTTGLFQYSRNPIYLGFALSLIGFWILLGTILPLIGCVLFIVITNYWYIPYEERAMEKIFGSDYKDYRSKVRRWL